MIAIRYSRFFIPISPIPGFWQLKTSNSIWFVVIWYPFHVHAFFVYAFLFCWSCDLFKGKLLKQAYAYESVLITGLWQDSTEPASVAQLDAPSNWRPGGRGFNPRRGRQHSFVEIDHEIFSTVILFLPLIQEGQLSVSGGRMCTILVNRLED